MEKYYIFGIIAAVAVFAFVLLLFGVGKSSLPNKSVPLQAYGIANSSLKSAVYNDIIGLQTYQNAIPNGKQLLYSVNYSLSTSASLSNGSGSNSTENAKGHIQMFHGLNSNSEAFSNFTISVPLSSGIGYNLTSLSYVFAIGNNTDLCSGSSSTLGKVSCGSLNQSIETLDSGLFESLNISRISLLEAYNTTYDGYPCLFTVSTFAIAINSSNSSLIAGKTGKEVLSGISTSCFYRDYNITVLNSLAADLSVSMEINGTNFTSTSFISYNESLSKISNFNYDINQNSLPNKSI
ncbi:hypothetical protein M1494_00585 [Candidatus Parvarchaeota archaeon]|nr:hypothetical protein [Candidatus Parvarchaeota archaeon]